MGCAGTVQMCHQVLVKPCWLHLAQEGLAVLSNLRLSSTSPGASGSRGFFWHRFVTSWITLVGDNLSHIPAHLSEGLELRIYRCLSLCIKDIELHVLSLPSFLSFWEHLAAVAASTSCLCYHRGLIRAQPAREHCSCGADGPWGGSTSVSPSQHLASCPHISPVQLGEEAPRAADPLCAFQHHPLGVSR